MKAQELIENCLQQYRKPFSPAILSGLTGVGLRTVQNVIAKQIEAGRVRKLEPGIYCSVKPEQMNNSTVIGRQHWRFNLESAKMILDQIDAGNNSGCRKIGKALGVSRQFVYMYLVALCSIGSVGVNESGYTVIKRDNLLSLGSNIQKGIIRRLRAEQGLKNGQNRGQG